MAKERKKTALSIITMLMAVATVLGYPAAAPGQEPQSRTAELTGFWLTTPYPELAIRPGETETIPLTLRNSNQPPQRASIEVSGIPQDWKWSLKGENREVSAVIVGPDATQEVKLELTRRVRPVTGSRSMSGRVTAIKWPSCRCPSPVQRARRRAGAQARTADAARNGEFDI